MVTDDHTSLTIEGTKNLIDIVEGLVREGTIRQDYADSAKEYYIARRHHLSTKPVISSEERLGLEEEDYKRIIQKYDFLGHFEEGLQQFMAWYKSAVGDVVREKADKLARQCKCDGSREDVLTIWRTAFGELWNGTLYPLEHENLAVNSRVTNEGGSLERVIIKFPGDIQISMMVKVLSEYSTTAFVEEKYQAMVANMNRYKYRVVRASDIDPKLRMITYPEYVGTLECLKDTADDSQIYEDDEKKIVKFGGRTKKELILDAVKLLIDVSLDLYEDMVKSSGKSVQEYENDIAEKRGLEGKLASERHSADIKRLAELKRSVEKRNPTYEELYDFIELNDQTAKTLRGEFFDKFIVRAHMIKEGYTFKDNKKVQDLAKVLWNDPAVVRLLDIYERSIGNMIQEIAYLPLNGDATIYNLFETEDGEVRLHDFSFLFGPIQRDIFDIFYSAKLSKDAREEIIEQTAKYAKQSIDQREELKESTLREDFQTEEFKKGFRLLTADKGIKKAALVVHQTAEGNDLANMRNEYYTLAMRSLRENVSAEFALALRQYNEENLEGIFTEIDLPDTLSPLDMASEIVAKTDQGESMAALLFGEEEAVEQLELMRQRMANGGEEVTSLEEVIEQPEDEDVIRIPVWIKGRTSGNALSYIGKTLDEMDDLSALRTADDIRNILKNSGDRNYEGLLDEWIAYAAVIASKYALEMYDNQNSRDERLAFQRKLAKIQSLIPFTERSEMVIELLASNQLFNTLLDQDMDLSENYLMNKLTEVVIESGLIRNHEFKDNIDMLLKAAIDAWIENKKCNAMQQNSDTAGEQISKIYDAKAQKALRDIDRYKRERAGLFDLGSYSKLESSDKPEVRQAIKKYVEKGIFDGFEDYLNIEPRDDPGVASEGQKEECEDVHSKKDSDRSYDAHIIMTFPEDSFIPKSVDELYAEHLLKRERGETEGVINVVESKTYNILKEAMENIADVETLKEMCPASIKGVLMSAGRLSEEEIDRTWGMYVIRLLKGLKQDVPNTKAYSSLVSKAVGLEKYEIVGMIIGSQQTRARLIEEYESERASLESRLVSDIPSIDKQPDFFDDVEDADISLKDVEIKRQKLEFLRNMIPEEIKEQHIINMLLHTYPLHNILAETHEERQYHERWKLKNGMISTGIISEETSDDVIKGYLRKATEESVLEKSRGYLEKVYAIIFREELERTGNIPQKLDVVAKVRQHVSSREFESLYCNLNAIKAFGENKQYWGKGAIKHREGEQKIKEQTITDYLLEMLDDTVYLHKLHQVHSEGGVTWIREDKRDFMAQVESLVKATGLEDEPIDRMYWLERLFERLEEQDEESAKAEKNKPISVSFTIDRFMPNSMPEHQSEEEQKTIKYIKERYSLHNVLEAKYNCGDILEMRDDILRDEIFPEDMDDATLEHLVKEAVVLIREEARENQQSELYARIFEDLLSKEKKCPDVLTMLSKIRNHVDDPEIERNYCHIKLAKMAGPANFGPEFQRPEDIDTEFKRRITKFRADYVIERMGVEVISEFKKVYDEKSDRWIEEGHSEEFEASILPLLRTAGLDKAEIRREKDFWVQTIFERLDKQEAEETPEEDTQKKKR